jgi:hypothetical protein
LALIKSQRDTRHIKVLADEFEDGTTSTRRYWADKNFKRQFIIEHSALTLEEFSVLRSFYTARNGQHDSFWYRDNVNRGGNASVRFASKLASSREQMMNLVGVDLHEVAPIRANADLHELVVAAGTRPLVWWDANRVRYYEHPVSGAQQTFIEAGIFDASERGNLGVWQSGGSQQAPGGILTQWQYFSTISQQWAKTAANLGIAASQPALTLFCFARWPNTSSFQTLLAVNGPVGSGHSISLDGSDFFGGYPIFAGSGFENNPVNTWRSLCATWPASANTMSFYANAALTSSGACAARTFGDGPAALGAWSDGSDKTESGKDGRIAHALVFPVDLTLAQIKAVHNLFCGQFGLSQVP